MRKNKSSKISILFIIFISLLIVANTSTATAIKWIFATDGVGYFSTTVRSGKDVMCVEYGGPLKSNSLKSGLKEGDTAEDFCSECKESHPRPDVRNDSSEKEETDTDEDVVEKAYNTEYTTLDPVDISLHQDVAYILTFGSDKEVNQTAMWQSSLNETGEYTLDQIKNTHASTFVDDAGLGDEAKKYKTFQEANFKNGSGFTKADNTDYDQWKIAVDQDDDTYTVGKYNIQYLEYSLDEIEAPTLQHWDGITNDSAADTTKKFSYIYNMKLKDQDGNELPILEIIAADTGDIINNRTDYKYPHNGEEFYVKFAYSPDIEEVFLDIEFKYLEKCETTVEKLNGTIYEWAWVEQDHSGTGHDHSCSDASADANHHHDCGYTTHNCDLDSSCGYTEHLHNYNGAECGTYADDYPDCLDEENYDWDCTETLNDDWGCNTYDHKEWILQKAYYRDAQTLLELTKWEGAIYWGYPVWKMDTLTTIPGGKGFRMELEGIVFIDLPGDKNTVDITAVNGLYDAGHDTPLPDIEVTLYEEGGTLATLLQEAGEIRTNPTLTDSDGHYVFKGLDAHKRYYVTFKINGQYLESTMYTADVSQYNTSNWAVSSKASILDSERDAYNSKFEEIHSSPGNYTTINNITGFGLSQNKTYNIFEQSYDKAQQEANDIETLQNDITQRIRNYISSNGTYPDSSAKTSIYQAVASANSGISEVKNKIQYIVDMEVIATTGNHSTIQYYPVYSKFVIDTVSRTIGATTYNAIYDGQRQINFGALIREKFDLKIAKDIYEVRITINGREHIYKCNSRQDEEVSTEIRGSDVLFEASSGRHNAYERDLRESDVRFIDYISRNPDRMLRVYVTYRTRVTNQSDSAITGYITGLNDFYSEDYTYLDSRVVKYNSAGVEFDNVLTWTNDTSTNTLTTTGISNIGLDVSEYFDIYTNFEVTTEAILDLLSNDETTKENYVEITGYKTYYTNQRAFRDGDVINSAGYKAGLVDRDSRPGDFEVTDAVKKFVEYSYTSAFKNKDGTTKTKESLTIFQDDADKAPGLNLKLLVENRCLKGNVWEDKIVREALENYNIRKGNGERDDSQPITNLRVELIDMQGLVTSTDSGLSSYSSYNAIADIYNRNNLSDATSNNGFKPAVTYTQSDGTYEFSGYIPGDYLVRFIYGETTILATDSTGKKVYNGEDYKSTLYTESDHQYMTSANEARYWYDETKNQIKSDAQDNLTRRNEINNINSTLDFYNASVLDYYQNRKPEYLADLETKTKLFADTEKLIMEVEYTEIEAEYTREKYVTNKSYVVENVDFGLVERPRQELTITKDIENIRLIANSGQTIFDAEEKTNNLAWVTPIKDIYNRDNDRNGMIQATIDENLMHGATIKVLYKISVENTGEKDYILSDGTVDKNFYNTGIPLSTSKLVATKADYIIDYVENNLKFNTDDQLDIIDKDKGYNKYWEFVKGEDNSGNSIDNLSTILTADNNSLIDPSLDTVVKGYNTIIKATDDSPLLYNLIPADKRGEQKETLATATNPTTKTETLLFLTKVLDTSDNTNDNFMYNNSLEIIKFSNLVGRRHYNNVSKSKYNEEDQITKDEVVTSIPGNYDPRNASDTTRSNDTVTREVDRDYAERITVLVPFGQRNMIWIIIGSIIAVAILGVGIILIKKKVLRK